MTDPILRVAVPARLDSDSQDARVVGARALMNEIVAMVQAQGFEPVVVDDSTRCVSEFAGLVLPGGNDVHPARYGEELTEEFYGIHPDQDALDFGLAEAAIESGVPVLGICRGLQVLNTVYGGTLVADLPASSVVHRDMNAVRADWAWHEVSLRADSPLAAEFGTTRQRVASGHHQAVRELGAGLVIEAIADDGIIEAFADPERDLFAVQWHPEATGRTDAVQAAPFRVFGAAVCRRGSSVAA